MSDSENNDVEMWEAADDQVEPTNSACPPCKPCGGGKSKGKRKEGAKGSGGKSKGKGRANGSGGKSKGKGKAKGSGGKSKGKGKANGSGGKSKGKGKAKGSGGKSKGKGKANGSGGKSKGKGKGGAKGSGGKKTTDKKADKLKKGKKVAVATFRKAGQGKGTGHPANCFILFFLETWRKQGGNIFQVARQCGILWWKMSESAKEKYRRMYCNSVKNSRACRKGTGKPGTKNPKPGTKPTKPKDPKPSKTGGTKPTKPKDPKSSKTGGSKPTKPKDPKPPKTGGTKPTKPKDPKPTKPPRGPC